jgi:hypothetical protein
VSDALIALAVARLVGQPARLERPVRGRVSRAAREVDPGLGVDDVGERAVAAEPLEPDASFRDVLCGPIDLAEGEEDERQLVLDRGDLAFGVGRPEVGQALRPRRQGRLQVAELVVAHCQREQERCAAPVVEQADHRPGLLEVAEGAFRLVVARVDGRERDQDPQAELGIDRQALGDLVEHSQEQLPGAVTLLELVQGARLP